MPMHDWTSVEPGVYHVLHGAWIYAISDALNDGLLPPAYYAMPEQRVPVLEVDVLTLRGRDTDPIPAAAVPAGSGRATAGLVERAARAPRSRQRRLTVRHVSNHRPVAVVELVSPGNTANRHEYRRFVGKVADLIDGGIHVLVINPFRAPPLAPAGLHAAIWKAVARPPKGQAPFSPTPDRPLLTASYHTSDAEVAVTLQPFAVGEPVPDAPLYLAADESHVTIPLDATYAAAFPRVPQLWREVLERAG